MREGTLVVLVTRAILKFFLSSLRARGAPSNFPIPYSQHPIYVQKDSLYAHTLKHKSNFHTYACLVLLIVQSKFFVCLYVGELTS